MSVVWEFCYFGFIATIGFYVLKDALSAPAGFFGVILKLRLLDFMLYKGRAQRARWVLGCYCASAPSSPPSLLGVGLVFPVVVGGGGGGGGVVA